jgi:hypothetical protein
MPRSRRIEGYAIVAEDGMLANAAGIMPDSLKFAADRGLFERARRKPSAQFARSVEAWPIRPLAPAWTTRPAQAGDFHIEAEIDQGFDAIQEKPARWTPTPPRQSMTAIGVDVAQGGNPAIGADNAGRPASGMAAPAARNRAAKNRTELR